MKILSFTKLCVATVATLFLVSSCSSSKEIDEEYAEYINSEDFTKDLDNFFYAGAIQQAMGSLVIHACSNEFTCTENDTVCFGDRKLAYWRDYALIMATLEEHRSEFKHSYERLNDMGVFEIPTPQLDEEGNVVALAPERTAGGKGPKSSAMDMIAPPAHAGTTGGILLFAQAFYEFCGITSDLARESRKQIITVAAKLSDKDRRELFDELDSHERQGETDYKTWWNNFADGKYDVRANRIYHTFIAAKDSPGKTNYLSVADDMGILSEKEFCSKAGRAITAGAKLYVECINKVVGNVAGSTTVYYGNMAKGENIKGMVLSYDQVYDVLDKVNNSVEYGRKIANGTVTKEDYDEYNMNTLKAIVADETSGWVVNLGKDTKISLDGQLGGGEFVEYGQVVWTMLKKGAEARNDPKLTWGTDEERMAQIQITDKDGKPTGMIIARDKETGAIYAVKEKEFNGDLAIQVPAGEYTVTALDKNGDKQTIDDVEVKSGEKKNLEVNKNEQEIAKQLVEQNKDDGWDAKTPDWWKEYIKKRREEKKAKEEKEKLEEEKKAAEEAKAEQEEEEREDQEEADQDDGKYGQGAAPKPNTSLPFSLQGKWKIVDVDVEVTGPLATEIPEAPIKGKIQEFKSDGTYTISGQKGSGKYKYGGGEFVTMDGHSYTLDKLGPDRIKLTYTKSYNQGGKPLTLKSVLTLVRIEATEEPKKEEPKKVEKPAPKPAPAPVKAEMKKKKKKKYRHVSGTY